jgi:hypothetical protein
MLSKQIETQAKKEIIEAINNILDRYTAEGLTIKELRRYFTNKYAIKTLIKDINEVGRKFFNNDDEYQIFIINMLKNILLDIHSENETTKLQENMNTIKKFSEFEYQTESMNYNEFTIEYLYNDVNTDGDNSDIVASYFNVNKEFVDVLDKKYSVYTITDFKTDITHNNRVKTNVLILNKEQLDKMKENVVNKILSAMYNQIPQTVQYCNIQINPHTVLDKKRIKESVADIINKKIIDIVSNVTKYSYVNQYGEDYYIWKKNK